MGSKIRNCTFFNIWGLKPWNFTEWFITFACRLSNKDNIIFPLTLGIYGPTEVQKFHNGTENAVKNTKSHFFQHMRTLKSWNFTEWFITFACRLRNTESNISIEIGALRSHRGPKVPKLDQKLGQKHKITLFQHMRTLKPENFTKLFITLTCKLSNKDNLIFPLKLGL